ncbi:peptidylprolyl isomerase, partial [Candidatus Aerophobetes bacterium]|nr:peptidylprolyl isomerase [Candidatus Aerophobetes bacterium]
MFLRELRKSVKPLMWVVAAGFIASLFFTYTRISSQEGAKPLVKINGEQITYLDFLRAYQDAYDRYIQATGERLSPEMESYLRSQVVSQLVSSELLYQEAKKARIKVSDAEVREEIGNIMMSFGSRENFMRYLQYRRVNYSDFEESMRRQIAISRLTEILRASVLISEQELEDYWILEREMLDVSYLFLNPERYAKDIKVDLEEAKKYYEENTEQFEVPERTGVEYILISPDEFKDEVKITEEEMQQYYQEQPDSFEVEERRRASHILIRMQEGATREGENKAREKLEEIKQQVEEGADFTELAKEYSDDRVSAEKGGDLGFFTYDTMTLEFSRAVFSLEEVGDLSNIVQTPYGLHLIKLTGIEPAYKKSFDEVKDQIKISLLEDRAEKLALEEIEKVRGEIERGSLSFEEYAREYPGRVRTSSLFARYDTVDDLSWDRRFNETAFSIEPGKISSP